MKASDLNEIIDIYKVTTTRSASGAVNEAFAKRCTTRARVNFASGSRTVSNDEIFYDVDRQFIIRHYIPVENTDEIRWNGQRWRILSIDHNREYKDIQISTTLINE